MTDVYLQKIQSALSASPFVAQPVISVDDRGEVWFIRADNAPHYPDFPSAPHHKHIGESKVVAADEPDIFMVLKEIENILQSSD